MAAIDWYYARDNKQMGPISPAELKNLAMVGQLRPDDLVWREGLSEWAPARSVRGLFEEEPKPPAAQESPIQAIAEIEQVVEEIRKPIVSKTAVTAHPVDRLLGLLRGDFNARFVDSITWLFRSCGLYGLWIAAAAVVVFQTVAMTKRDGLDNFLSGVILLLLLAALQYVAGKFCNALERLNRTVAVNLESTALPDSVAVLSIVVGLAFLFGSIPLAVQGATLPILVLGIAGFINFVFIAFVALNPATLHLAIASQEPPVDDETLGTLMFFAKLSIRAVPVALGTGILAGTILMGDACRLILTSEYLLPAEFTASIATTLLVFSASLPLIMYLAFLLFRLLLELCRAIITK